MSKICFYHGSDLDGHCSGAIVKKKFNRVRLEGVDYGDSIDDFEIKPGSTVYVVDFSFPPEEMMWLHTHCNLIWIDHHSSAIRNNETIYEGLRDDFADDKDASKRKAGCELTWMFLFPDRKMPWIVKLLGRYDVWDHSDPNVVHAQFGMNAIPYTSPSDSLWTYFLSDRERVAMSQVHQLIEDGQKIKLYQRKIDAIVAKKSFEYYLFDEFNVLVLNRSMCNSSVLDSVFDPNKHDFMVIYSFDGDTFKYSFYADAGTPLDMSVIANRVDEGGGGHRCAAGAKSKTNLFGSNTFSS